MKEFNIAVGKRIRKLREGYGFTRERLAESAGLNDKFLYEVETGKKGLSALRMKRLADALSVTMDFLAAGDTSRREYRSIIALLSGLPEQRLKNVEDILRNIAEISNIGQVSE